MSLGSQAGTLGIIVSLTALSSIVSAGPGGLEFFTEVTECEAAEAYLTEEYREELAQCIREKKDTELCTQIKEECLKLCLKTEETFKQAIDMEMDRMSRDFTTKTKLVDEVTVDFYRYELENGQSILDCVNKYGVPHQWVLSDSLKKEEKKSCSGTELTFLSTKQHCKHKWISQHHRSEFYGQCLGKFNMKDIRKRSSFATRNLEKIASVYKTERINRGKNQVGGGSAMILGGIFGGAGLLLPGVGPLALFFTAIGSLLGATGSFATLFGSDSTLTIEEAKLQIKSLKDQHTAISDLLVLYMEASGDALSFENKFQQQQEEITERIQSNYLSLISLGVNTKKLIGTAVDFNRMVQGSKSSILVRFMDHVFKPIQKVTGYFKNTFTDKIAKFTKSVIPAKFTTGFKTTGKILKFAAPVFDLAVGIYKVIEGTEKLYPTFNHQIMAASRRLSKEIDDLTEVYYSLIEENGSQDQDSSAELHNLYSIDVEVDDGNWDHYSGVYFTLYNGERECNTRGEQGYNSLSRGWTSLDSGTLHDCQFFEFRGSNLSITVHHHQNSLLRDKVKIKRIQVSVDGNYLPSFEVNANISVANGNRSEVHEFQPMKGLVAIYSHTSELYGSGTDAWVELKLKVDGDDSTGWIVLDNYGNDRERGSHDVYRGSDLDELNQKIRDYADFAPESSNITLWYKVTDITDISDQWSTDLLKLYFWGKYNDVVVIRCHAGEKWIKDGETLEFICQRMEQQFPGRSIEMFEAHTCNYYYSGSGGNMKLKFCKEKDQFKTFNDSVKQKDCCSTNYFPVNSKQNKRKKYDTIQERISDNSRLDGGAVLGECEGFDLLGTKIYIGMEADTTDKGCFDELAFYGNPVNGSTTDLPFASCHFHPTEFDSKQVRQYDGRKSTSWTDHMDMPVLCEYSTAYNSITQVNVVICESKGSGSKDPLLLRLENDDGKQCETGGLSVRNRGHFLNFSSRDLGACKDFNVTTTTKAWVSNAGNDDLCLTDLFLDTANKNGRTKMLRCSYDTKMHESMIVHGSARALPLLCY